MSETTLERSLAAIANFEAGHVADLRRICNAIGYGRAIQIAEGWMEEKHPGWLDARRAVMAEEHARAPYPESAAARQSRVLSTVHAPGCPGVPDCKPKAPWKNCGRMRDRIREAFGVTA